MQGMPYVPGRPPEAPGPLTRFLPPLPEGTVARWLADHVAPSSWLLDPFGFSTRLPLEAALAGYRVLVTVNNPITRFLLELSVDPPTQADFKAALADLAASKRGDERLESHIQSLYLTRCEQCGREVQVTEFLWQEGADAPFARTYECMECGDRGQKSTTSEDVERARKLGATDALHRSRALERVAARDDPERPHVLDAIQHYLPRPLYVITTLINRIESLGLSPARERAITAAVLLACDAGNTMWAHREPTPRPKHLFTPEEFREQNLWMILEGASQTWPAAAQGTAYSAWPNRIPETGGICVYEGRLKNLANEVQREIPIAAVVASVPRPNQAFWTLSALWAGWLWGRPAVEPYRMALRRRRYDWAWNATALNSTFTHLADLLALGTPFFGLVPEIESQFLLSSMTAISAAGFDLRGLAVRSHDDPAQFLWVRGEHRRREIEIPPIEALRRSMREHLAERGEPASYLHVKAAALQMLAEAHALHREGQEMEASVRHTRTTIEAALASGSEFLHHTTGEAIDTGLWALREWPSTESLTDRVEVATVNLLQKKPECSLLDVEAEVFPSLPGLFTPMARTILAVLESYAEKHQDIWSIRDEDRSARRQEDLRTIGAAVEAIGSRLKYKVRRDGKWLIWEQGGQLVLAFSVLVSALVAPLLDENRFPPSQSILVVPGGRVGLITFKASTQPVLLERLRDYRLVRFRLWRALSDVKILTRESFTEQLSSDPVEHAQGQMMMF